MKYDYCFDDILTAYELVGVKPGGIIFIESDLACLGLYESNEISSITADHYRALRMLIGDKGTIVVPTFSTYLCNSSIPYDHIHSHSEMGALSEYIRQLPGSIRSDHALTSYSAIGLESKLCKNVSYLAYGPESPMDRMILQNTWFISIGLKPYDTCSTIHQTELTMGVPYRYIKEFIQPVVTTNGIKRKFFYMHVRYNSCELKKDKRNMFSSFERENSVHSHSLGRGKIYGYSMTDFYKYSIKFFRKNPYAIVSVDPDNRPYTRTV